MRRRDFIATLCTGALASQGQVRAQSVVRPRVVGALWGGAERDPDGERLRGMVLQTVAGRGWQNGSNMRLVERWAAGDSVLIERHASELAALPCDVIYSGGLRTLTALQAKTSTIPIVYIGSTNFDYPIVGKQLTLLKTALPFLEDAAFVTPKDSLARDRYFAEFKAAGDKLNVKVSLHTHVDASGDDLIRLVGAIGRQPRAAAVFAPDNLALVQRVRLADAAIEARLPTMFAQSRSFTAAGGFMSYVADDAEIYRGAGDYIDRLLRGARISDLPVQTPRKFLLTVNLLTARKLNIVVPDLLLAIADEVIE
jgi:putative ABC transport system substrate-binding protein